MANEKPLFQRFYPSAASIALTVKPDRGSTIAPAISASGSSTNRLSANPGCGTTKFPVAINASPNRSRSKSITRGPLSTTLTRPIAVSIASSPTISSWAAREVSTNNAPFKNRG